MKGEVKLKDGNSIPVWFVCDMHFAVGCKPIIKTKDVLVDYNRMKESYQQNPEPPEENEL